MTDRRPFAGLAARRTRLAGRFTLAAGLLLAAAACQEALPTAESDILVQGGVAAEVTLPFRDFATDARVFGGYGRVSELSGGFIAHEFGAGPGAGGVPAEGLEAATLLRFGRYPASVSVLDTTGTTRPDTALTFLSGRIVARFDTLASVLTGPVEVTAHAITEPWDGVSATWQFAVDTVGHREPWSQVGGGAVEELGSGVWDRGAGDTLVITIDSARVASWADSTDLTRGVRLNTDAPGVRLKLTSALLWLETLPSINPDTIIQVLADTEIMTFIYSPLPSPPDGPLRVGGAPAWRTILDLALPRTLDGPPSLCALVGCPVEIDEGHVSYAGLRLTTRTESPAFAPSDTLIIDLRMVMVPEILPKSPLGPSAVGLFGEILSPEWFRPPAGQVVEIPVTELVRDLLRGETSDGDQVSNTVALLSAFEPLTIEYASFEGAQSPGAPELRLILNFSGGSGG